MVSPHPLSWADAPPYHYHGTTQPPPAPAKEDGGAVARAGAGQDEGARSLWIGGLLHWMNEDYLYACFTYSPELLSLVVKRSKHTGQSEGFGFLRFNDHATATRILKSYNGQKMPNADQDFNLNWAAQSYAPNKLPDQDSKLDWATQQDGHTNDTAAASEHVIFVGDLAYDVTEYMLHHLFKSRYPSVKSAKVIFDKLTGRSKGYGFVRFGDANEHVQAMTEMNGAYCSTRPMRIGPAPNKKYFDHSTQGTDSYHDPNNSRLFVGSLDQSITDDDLLRAFSPYGELVNVRVLPGKACGFVTYSNRASAEEAMRMLNGSQLGGNNLRLTWGRRSGNKQDPRNGGQHGRPKCIDPSSFGWSPQDPYAYAQTGHPGYGYYQHQLPTVQ
ncbi:hypothetical protein SEVIR_2G002400v4 [Setaria viridis]|uniref:RRM domain-containing protein n=1 Tax=Setaria viridis TaxID=4556 RepID=A0A4U6VQ97_SETVI|nr:polyadenylate-binding protein RBP45-like [Setaria viridis]TKW29949.1 hypothetical protein SEVIR_2G002400v2 [Setaria viridis]